MKNHERKRIEAYGATLKQRADRVRWLLVTQLSQQDKTLARAVESLLDFVEDFPQLSYMNYAVIEVGAGFTAMALRDGHWQTLAGDDGAPVMAATREGMERYLEKIEKGKGK